ncbi:SPRY domain-containing protein 3 [Globodera pallida]|nr:SPRY domain-containing protein 3 [Globodera pallida]
MSTFIFLAAIYFLVAVSILLETDASPPPKTNTKREKGPSSSDNAEPNAATSRQWNRLIDEIINNSESRTLYTVDPIKKSGIYYYEVKVKERRVNGVKQKLKGHVSIGLGTKKRVVGNYDGFAYDSSGFFIATGCPQSLDAPKFGANDVVGCGVDFANRIIFYTKNGQRLDPVGEFVDSAADLFPRVSLTHPDDDIEENFEEKEFAYKF